MTSSNSRGKRTIFPFFAALVFFLPFLFFSCAEGKVYDLKKEPIDVIIPCTEKDLPTLEFCIKGIKEYGKEIRRVIVISDKRLTTKAEWFDEKNYPFTKEEIAHAIFQDEAKGLEYVQKPGSRIGWIYQQLLKFYAPFVIPNISSNILLLDADTVFINPIEFLNEKGGGCFNIGDEFHQPYFDHAKRLLPEFKKQYPDYSGITHHMLFQRPIVTDLMETVEKTHNCPFWKAIVQCIEKDPVPSSSFSEYEIYFNFALSQTDQVEIRPLLWKNTRSLKSLKKYKKRNYHYLSCHDYLRTPKQRKDKNDET